MGLATRKSDEGDALLSVAWSRRLGRIAARSIQVLDAKIQQQHTARPRNKPENHCDIRLSAAKLLVK